ncbi:bifunctional DNA primase/polymerase [Brevibacterium casei]|uniref:DNA primase/polymerase bifunctional N-terminal domain-containing protein n=1 Tax=Brevibacterium ammoniilyticum TaxID=1046555 RepID=A0ABP9U1T5_9MICO|nr:bifunctional DNA primase/polymerase [Brevibacterium casei]QQT68753.1 bifunctional DNA primase/polymerase [Brevibacterium casei]
MPHTKPLLPLEQAAVLPLREAAHAYAEAGVGVFPCWPGSKRPAMPHSFQDASTSHRQIDSWWSWQPEANIALRTGDHTDVLDIDVHPTGDGFTRLRELLDAGLGTEWAHAVRSPSGGLHLYYPSDPDAPQPSWNRVREHVDFRGTGGYIIAAPSRITHAGQSRGQYQPIGAAYPGRPVQAEQIRELLTPARPDFEVPVLIGESRDDYGSRISDWLAGYDGSDPSGAAYWSACRLVEAGADEPTAYTYLAAPSAQLGLRESELVGVIIRAHHAAGPDPDVMAWLERTGQPLSPTRSSGRSLP